MNARSLFVTVLAVAVIAVGAPVAGQQSDGGKIALLIGNANYPDADAPLKQPVTDARAVADELRRNGFETDVAENLTKEAMQRAIERLYGKVKPGSAVVFFFSGYGIQTGRQSHLIPVNAQIWTEAEVRRDGFGIDTVLAELNARGAGVKLAILDASRRNPFERRFRGVSTGLAPVTAPRGTLVISATAPGTVVSDGDTENSMFVRELLKEMRSPGLMVEEIFNRTRIGVSRVSKGEQVPWISSSLVEDFYLGKAPAAQASVDLRPLQIEPRPPQVEPRPPREFDADVRRDYDFAERLGTRKGWDDFLAKYKSGLYAEMARDKLARLDAPPPAPPPAPKPEVKPEPKPGPTAKVEPTPPPPPPTEPLVQELDRQITQEPNNPDN